MILHLFDEKLFLLPTKNHRGNLKNLTLPKDHIYMYILNIMKLKPLLIKYAYDPKNRTKSLPYCLEYYYPATINRYRYLKYNSDFYYTVLPNINFV